MLFISRLPWRIEGLVPGFAGAEVEAVRREGCLGLPGLLADWVEAIAAGIERNITEPGPLASENVGVDESGRFFNDGRRAVSFWVPVDPVTEATLRFVAGSHLWPKPLLRARRQDVLVR